MTLVWFNGRISRGGTVMLPADNRGYSLGDGLFETMLLVNCEVADLDAHLARMAASSAALGLPFSAMDARTAVNELGAKAGAKPHALRLRLLRGEPSILMATASAHDTTLIGQPARLITSSIRRNSQSIASTHKTLSYVDAMAAMRAAAEAKADGALMLNTQGFVASSPIANLFLLKSDTLITPGLEHGILPGTTRARLLREALSLGLRPVECTVERDELFTADAVFLTNSLRLLTPVTEIDAHLTGARDCRFILDHLVPEQLKEYMP